jgi:DNA-binding CsgD family transcriptional regulator
MRHLPVFLNLLGLAFGIACLARLSLAYALKKDPYRLSRLVFFASYSFLMTVAFFFSYYLINVGSGLGAQRVFASLIFAGMAVIEPIFPWMMRPVDPQGKLAAPAPAVFVAATITAAQVAAIWIVPDRLSLIPMVAAFIPFSSVVAWAFIRAKKTTSFPPLKRGEAFFFLLYIPVIILAIGEILFLFQSDPGNGYALLSLPLAYGLSSIQFLKISSVPEIASRGKSEIELPASLVERAQLTAREREMAQLILQGKENKEIANALSLSENTVRNHIYNLYRKLGIQRRMDLVGLIREENERTGT